MKNLGLSNVSESTGSIPPGGYICRILNVQDVPSKEYLIVKLDIAQGPYTGHYKELEERFGFWGLTWYMSYKSTALGMFKAGISALRASNSAFQWNDDAENDERVMVGCMVGAILGEEEYLSNDGTLKCNVKFKSAVSTQAIIDGQFKVPERKKLASFDNSAEVIDTTAPPDTQYTTQVPVTGQNVNTAQAPATSQFMPVDDSDIPFK